MSAAFAVGDLVSYEGKHSEKVLQCKIVKVMPLENSSTVRNYRIRGNAEAFDRAVPEFTLTRIEPTTADALFKP